MTASFHLFIILIAIVGILRRTEKGQASMTVAHTPIFSDNFKAGTLDLSKWLVSARRYRAGNSKGMYRAENIDLSTGILRIKITASGNDLTGGEIQSRNVFGYGTYTFTMRMTTTADTRNGIGRTLPASCAAGFIFVNDSETELDFEFLGNQPDKLHMTTWHTRVTEQQHDETTIKGLADGLHTYKIVWKPERVQYLLDGGLYATHTKNVPTTPAYILLNHRAMNDPHWGGLATDGTQYMYVSEVSFTPTV